MRLKVLTVVGARPQFIKAAPLSRELRESHDEVLVHTGQHYDQSMSEVFFGELGIPRPDYNLAVGSGSHGAQTGQMMIALEEVVQRERPDWVLVYGDTNSTLAGALVASKLHVPIAHVEAGLRSNNRRMPEEVNRMLTDHISDLLFCPTETAVGNLRDEGVQRGVHYVGDIMLDATLRFSERAEFRAPLVERMGIMPGGYYLATVHRAENTDDPERLTGILSGLAALERPVIFPVHPRTRARLASLPGRPLGGNIRPVEPVGYLDMLQLERHARTVLTDSGGVQKEAFFLGVPCVTLREETEWMETVESGWNRLVGADAVAIREAVRAAETAELSPPRLEVFGAGQAGRRITAVLGGAGAAREKIDSVLSR